MSSWTNFSCHLLNISNVSISVAHFSCQKSGDGKLLRAYQAFDNFAIHFELRCQSMLDLILKRNIQKNNWIHGIQIGILRKRLWFSSNFILILSCITFTQPEIIAKKFDTHARNVFRSSEHNIEFCDYVNNNAVKVFSKILVWCHLCQNSNTCWKHERRHNLNWIPSRTTLRWRRRRRQQYTHLW